jgi:hypothetical protein
VANDTTQLDLGLLYLVRYDLAIERLSSHNSGIVKRAERKKLQESFFKRRRLPQAMPQPLGVEQYRYSP